MNDKVISNAITKRPEMVLMLYLSCGDVYAVGGDNVTAIEPYDEYGEMSYVPWFNVWRGAELWCKVNGAHVSTVTYFNEGLDHDQS